MWTVRTGISLFPAAIIVNKTLLDELGLALPETSTGILGILSSAKEWQLGVTADGSGFGLADIGATFLCAYLTANFSTDLLSTADGARGLANLPVAKASFSGTWESSI